MLLGVLQGATEFLPVSSSAHLVIFSSLLQVPSTGLVLEIALHLGTLVSVVIYFRRDLWGWVAGFTRPGPQGVAARREVGLIAVATLPALLAALAFGDNVARAFDDVTFTGAMLLVTTAVLVSSRWSPQGQEARLGVRHALIIGVAQSFALLPGISRAGITIVAGLWLGLGGVAAARFAFLLAIPAILGAGVYSLLDLGELEAGPVAGLWLGFLAAALVGYGVIGWLMRVLQRKRLHFFAGYTFLLGLVVIFWL
ncbi:MAG: undecaprenyl-diphosphate phosphatase [Candidatus Neomarinimicrobiota bacterium]